jgi:UDP-N-acetylmuramate dehydrogenase
VEFPGIVAFPHAENYKLAAAWMIEQCGWKGRRIGDAGVHVSQPLVLVNYGSATGQEILDLANRIRDDVKKKFGVWLETEVNIIPGKD